MFTAVLNAASVLIIVFTTTSLIFDQIGAGDIPFAFKYVQNARKLLKSMMNLLTIKLI